MFSADGMALLQNPLGLHCDSPIGACHKLHMVFYFPTTGNSNINRVCSIIWSKQYGFALHSSFAVTQSFAGTAFCVTW